MGKVMKALCDWLDSPTQDLIGLTIIVIVVVLCIIGEIVGKKKGET